MQRRRCVHAWSTRRCVAFAEHGAVGHGKRLFVSHCSFVVEPNRGSEFTLVAESVACSGRVVASDVLACAFADTNLDADRHSIAVIANAISNTVADPDVLADPDAIAIAIADPDAVTNANAIADPIAYTDAIADPNPVADTDAIVDAIADSDTGPNSPRCLTNLNSGVRSTPRRCLGSSRGGRPSTCRRCGECRRSS